MFRITEGPKKTYPYEIIGAARKNAGMWVVHEGSDQYRAWKYWLHHEIGKHFFPEPTMQVWFEYPPRNQTEADMVAQSISDIRDGEDPFTWKRKDNSRPPIGGEAVPMHPSPWEGYIPEPEIEEPIISADAMRMIRERLEKNWTGSGRP